MHRHDTYWHVKGVSMLGRMPCSLTQAIIRTILVAVLCSGHALMDDIFTSFSITGTGFHRHLKYHISQQKILEKSQCRSIEKVVLIQALPRETFVDPYQLEDLRRHGAFSFELFGTLDLEQPASVCQPLSLALTINTTAWRNPVNTSVRDGDASSSAEVVLEIPVHARYPVPVWPAPGLHSWWPVSWLMSGHVEVRLEAPCLLVQCSMTEAETGVRTKQVQQGTAMPFTDEQQPDEPGCVDNRQQEAVVGVHAQQEQGVAARVADDDAAGEDGQRNAVLGLGGEHGATACVTGQHDEAAGTTGTTGWQESTARVDDEGDALGGKLQGSFTWKVLWPFSATPPACADVDFEECNDLKTHAGQCSSSRESSSSCSGGISSSGSSSHVVWVIPTGNLAHEAMVAWGTLGASLLAALCVGTAALRYGSKATC